MLYLLSELQDVFGPLRLFDYVTFRAGGAAITAFLLVVLLGSWTARKLRELNTLAADRYAGILPEEFINKDKLRTPCMGGLLIVGAVTVSSLLWNELPNPITLVLLGVMLAMAAIGFVDDYRKVVHKQRDGLSARSKLLLQTLIAAAAVLLLDRLPETGGHLRELMVPFFKAPVWTSGWVLLFSIGVIVAAANAVNLTDGKDGLASGCTALCMVTYAVFAYLMGHRVFASYLGIPFIPGVSEAVVFAAAIAGACLGFLWHNCFPASMFMGDTGSLALGGTVGLIAVLVRQELLLLLVGIIFVIEAGSAMLQILSVRLTGKRIFLCTPIHHHFERKNWTETQIVIRFWIIAIVCSLLALATLKLR